MEALPLEIFMLVANDNMFVWGILARVNRRFAERLGSEEGRSWAATQWTTVKKIGHWTISSLGRWLHAVNTPALQFDASLFIYAEYGAIGHKYMPAIVLDDVNESSVDGMSYAIWYADGLPVSNCCVSIDGLIPAIGNSAKYLRCGVNENIMSAMDHMLVLVDNYFQEHLDYDLISKITNIIVAHGIINYPGTVRASDFRTGSNLLESLMEISTRDFKIGLRNSAAIAATAINVLTDT